MLRLLQQHVHNLLYYLKHMLAVWLDRQVGQTCLRTLTPLPRTGYTAVDLLSTVINDLQEASGTPNCVIASVKGQITDLSWREAAGAGVGDLEHVWSTSGLANLRRYASSTRIRYKEDAMCPVALQQPPQPASATGNCQQQHLHIGTAWQQLPGECAQQ
jgi:hypothetical protein